MNTIKQGEDTQILIRFESAEDITDAQEIELQLRYGKEGTDGCNTALCSYKLSEGDFSVDNNILVASLPASLTSTLNYRETILWQIKLIDANGVTTLPVSGILSVLPLIVREDI